MDLLAFLFYLHTQKYATIILNSLVLVFFSLQAIYIFPRDQLVDLENRYLQKNVLFLTKQSYFTCILAFTLLTHDSFLMSSGVSFYLVLGAICFIRNFEGSCGIMMAVLETIFNTKLIYLE